MKIVIGCDPNAQSVKEEVIAYCLRNWIRRFDFCK